MKNNPIFNDKAPQSQSDFESASETVENDEALGHGTTSEADNDWPARYAELQAQCDTQKEDFLRRVAEFENSRKRLAKEKEELIKYANEKILNDIFPVLDSLEMTLSHVKPDAQNDAIVSGVQLTLKQFLQVLQKHGLEEIGQIGETFDPNWHEAIASVESPDQPESGKLVQVHRKGYKLKDRLVRAALVTVSK